MPAGRAVLRAAKCTPALIETMPWYTGPFAGAVADARVRAGQDPAVHLGADDPDPADATSLLPSPTKHPVAAPRSGAVTVS
ncbi:hypothetical protein HQ325_01170 [Rhodococcus sp. BP-349]|uniref:hypothetical protein n=1 Tax=unclassified Rhodococcus (in: high G+C Gram-positive bacteria) TaxID=192944 RepID=UPI001C9A665D|nr:MULTISPECIES: hypothetical protein [unclassified Rhodococcus (in: high G+C Gram-positive bacteria)]MBY6537271.1 hypothetical protein [Rhodococcus sp. BP-363]MBY6541608.1 hypothetical protein [Rhodococcus sp. BP-369]MBY6560838.1 hypothetical protein [Rhodococcus sp. BP-370]MBY6575130.1 hypothetical protein [Rhodococcus sp. BP-364]MBY6584431.1 hypothetical protein [Rhodococcus sp. BP-358]